MPPPKFSDFELKCLQLSHFLPPVSPPVGGRILRAFTERSARRWRSDGLGASGTEPWPWASQRATKVRTFEEVLDIRRILETLDPGP